MLGIEPALPGIERPVDAAEIIPWLIGTVAVEFHSFAPVHRRMASGPDGFGKSAAGKVEIFNRDDPRGGACTRVTLPLDRLKA